MNCINTKIVVILILGLAHYQLNCLQILDICLFTNLILVNFYLLVSGHSESKEACIQQLHVYNFTRITYTVLLSCFELVRLGRVWKS